MVHYVKCYLEVKVYTSTKFSIINTSGESGLKDQVALQWLYTITILAFISMAARSIKIVQYARIISRHADGISWYSVPASASPLLPLINTIINIINNTNQCQWIRKIFI